MCQPKDHLLPRERLWCQVHKRLEKFLSPLHQEQRSHQDSHFTNASSIYRNIDRGRGYIEDLLASIIVVAFPPSASLRSHVSAESRMDEKRIFVLLAFDSIPYDDSCDFPFVSLNISWYEAVPVAHIFGAVVHIFYFSSVNEASKMPLKLL